MKQLIIFFTLLVVVFFLGSCDFFTGNKALDLKSRCSSCMEYNNIRPASKLDVNLLRAMTHNFQNSAVTSDDNNKSKTRSVWLSLEKLKQFVYEVESKTCDCDSAQLGVRVYFGEYPEDIDWQNGFQSDLSNPNAPDGNFRSTVLDTTGMNTYAKRATIFMVPTINSGRGNQDFDPADKDRNCKGGYDVRKFYEAAGGVEKYNNSGTWLHKALGVSVTALSATNHGDACPPPSGGCVTKGSFADFDH